MKRSELIKQLENHNNIFGDGEVYLVVKHNNGYTGANIKDIHIDCEDSTVIVEE